ncbi:MAG: ATP synthase F1 subunit delta [Cyanobacteriota bacterium]|nr:ATP synthase F1 subunit delta [Cyanobacteriota bacterium]
MAAGAMAQQIADPYAEALLALASAHNLVDSFAADIRFVVAALEAAPELGQFLASPIIKVEAKKQLLESVLQDQIHPLILNTFKLLTDRRRIMFITAVCQRFLELQRKLQRVALAEVTSAIELTDVHKQAIRDRVMQFSQVSSVELQSYVDSSLIGGVIIKVGSQVMDLSLRGQLRRLALQLA